MKTLYLDIFSGISGDMLLGALLDLGVDLPALERELQKLDLGGYHLHAVRQLKGSIQGIKFDVHLEEGDGGHAHDHEHGHGDGHEHGHRHEHEHEQEHEHSHARHEHHHHDHHHHDHDHHHEHGHGHGHGHGDGHEHAHHHSHDSEHDHEHHHEHGDDPHHGHPESRDYAEIRRLIEGSRLSDWVKEKALAVFQRIAVAEGKIHGVPAESVHFHEVGGIDSIVDIVGACAALELLGRPRVLAAPVVEGSGWVDCAHGRFPIPAMATLEILGARGIAVTQCEEPNELVTPTGAALLAEFVEAFGPMQGLVAQKVGYGLGTRNNLTRPNVLRAVLGESSLKAESGAYDWERDEVLVLETNLDDCSAELLGHFMDKALRAGALDVFYIPIQMKKNRPGVLLTVLCEAARQDQMAELILSETSAFGVRIYRSDRRKLRREWRTCRTPFGEVSVKIGKLNGRSLQVAPEFESCRKLANEQGVPLRKIYESVLGQMQEGE